jgi:hypothetical protein
MARNGGKAVRWRDLRDGVGREVGGRLQRLSCSCCGRVEYAGAPVLARGFRITPALFRAVAEECRAEPFSAVAERHGLDRKTVRAVWGEWTASLVARAAHPDVAVLSEVGFGGRRVGVVSAGDGGVCAVFGAPADKAMAAWLSGHPGGLVSVDWRWAPAAADLAPPGVAVTVGRWSLSAWFEAALPSILKKARRWMDAADRRAMAAVAPILLKAAAARSPDEDDALAAALADSPMLREIAAAADGFRKVWQLGSASSAARLYARWRTGLSSFAARAFAPAAALVDRLAGALFGEGWGVPAPAPSVGSVLVDAADSPDRVAAKVLAAAVAPPFAPPPAARRGGAAAEGAGWLGRAGEAPAPADDPFDFGADLWDDVLPIIAPTA